LQRTDVVAFAVIVFVFVVLIADVKSLDIGPFANGRAQNGPGEPGTAAPRRSHHGQHYEGHDIFVSFSSTSSGCIFSSPFLLQRAATTTHSAHVWPSLRCSLLILLTII
jgi:hypothetical protein